MVLCLRPIPIGGSLFGADSHWFSNDSDDNLVAYLHDAGFSHDYCSTNLSSLFDCSSTVMTLQDTKVSPNREGAPSESRGGDCKIFSQAC